MSPKSELTYVLPTESMSKKTGDISLAFSANILSAPSTMGKDRSNGRFVIPAELEWMSPGQRDDWWRHTYPDLVSGMIEEKQS